MEKRERFAIRRLDSLDAMRAEECRYGQGQPAHLRLEAAARITEEIFELQSIASGASRLQRALLVRQRFLA